MRYLFCHGPTGSKLVQSNVMRNHGGYKTRSNSDWVSACNHIYDGVILPNREAVLGTALRFRADRAEALSHIPRLSTQRDSHIVHAIFVQNESVVTPSRRIVLFACLGDCHSGDVTRSPFKCAIKQSETVPNIYLFPVGWHRRFYFEQIGGQDAVSSAFASTKATVRTVKRRGARLGLRSRVGGSIDFGPLHTRRGRLKVSPGRSVDSSRRAGVEMSMHVDNNQFVSDDGRPGGRGVTVHLNSRGG